MWSWNLIYHIKQKVCKITACLTFQIMVQISKANVLMWINWTNMMWDYDVWDYVCFD